MYTFGPFLLPRETLGAVLDTLLTVYAASDYAVSRIRWSLRLRSIAMRQRCDCDAMRLQCECIATAMHCDATAKYTASREGLRNRSSVWKKVVI